MVHCITITTVFFIDKMAFCSLGVQVEVKAEVKDPFIWYHYILYKVVHPHWYENLKSGKSGILPLNAMKS
jgi:hypothetical protein